MTISENDAADTQVNIDQFDKPMPAGYRGECVQITKGAGRMVAKQGSVSVADGIVSLYTDRGRLRARAPVHEVKVEAVSHGQVRVRMYGGWYTLCFDAASVYFPNSSSAVTNSSDWRKTCFERAIEIEQAVTPRALGKKPPGHTATGGFAMNLIFGIGGLLAIGSVIVLNITFPDHETGSGVSAGFTDAGAGAFIAIVIATLVLGFWVGAKVDKKHDSDDSRSRMLREKS
ncbi:MAG: hypothetical protein FWD83_00935 [Promicromonosporaceae bacterium]|nr:hypothetical protein [Promicromonosporaceae bacterium]